MSWVELITVTACTGMCASLLREESQDIISVERAAIDGVASARCLSLGGEDDCGATWLKG